MHMNMMKSHDKFENETRTSLNNQAAKLRNLEVQMGQIALLLSERGNTEILLVLQRSTQGEKKRSIAKL